MCYVTNKIPFSCIMYNFIIDQAGKLWIGPKSYLIASAD